MVKKVRRKFLAMLLTAFLILLVTFYGLLLLVTFRYSDNACRQRVRCALMHAYVQESGGGGVLYELRDSGQCSVVSGKEVLEENAELPDTPSVRLLADSAEPWELGEICGTDWRYMASEPRTDCRGS